MANFALEADINYLIVILRLIHILTGMFWIGSIIFFSFFVMPTIRATAESGIKFLMHITAKKHLGTAIDISARLAAIAGGFLYWFDSDGLTSKWLYSGPGWGFAIGGIFGLVGLLFSTLAVKKIDLLVKMGSQSQEEPIQEQIDQFQSTQKQLSTFGVISSIALIIALICMATARYWRV